MKSLREKIEEVIQSDASREEKRRDLINLGINAKDIAMFFKIYKIDKEDEIPYTLGVEIECFNVNRDEFIRIAREKGVEIQHEAYNHDTRNHYKVVNDGSIQGVDGLECVSPVLKGKVGLKSLKIVCDSLNRSGAKVNKSTGLHVHVGLQNVSFEQYQNIFINYIHLESVIDSFMAPSRRGNENAYCRTMQGISIDLLSQCCTNNDIRWRFNNSRYYKVNPVSFERHNTIEFRQHQGTTEYEKIEAWVKFICKLVTWSKNNRLAATVASIDNIPFLTGKEKEYFNNRVAAFAARTAQAA